MNINGTIIRRVYGEYTITSFLGNFGACANIRYQAAFLPPPSRPGYEAKSVHAHVRVYTLPALPFDLHTCTCTKWATYMYI